MEPQQSAGAPDWSWVWLLLGGIAVLVLAVLAGVRLLGAPEENGDSAEAAPASAASSASASPVAGAVAPSAPIRCWDGSGEQAVDDCTLPDGAAGLAWVFPHLSEQKCGRPTATGPGVVVRILCTTRLSDGSRILLGYYQWESVQAGLDFYDAQGFQSADSSGFHSWTGRSDDTLKSVLLYVDAPFSQAVTLPDDVQATDADLVMLQPRPPVQVRGEPVG